MDRFANVIQCRCSRVFVVPFHFSAIVWSLEKIGMWRRFTWFSDPIPDWSGGNWNNLRHSRDFQTTIRSCETVKKLTRDDVFLITLDLSCWQCVSAVTNCSMRSSLSASFGFFRFPIASRSFWIAEVWIVFWMRTRNIGSLLYWTSNIIDLELTITLHSGLDTLLKSARSARIPLIWKSLSLSVPPSPTHSSSHHNSSRICIRSDTSSEYSSWRSPYIRRNSLLRSVFRWTCHCKCGTVPRPFWTRICEEWGSERGWQAKWEGENQETVMCVW